VVCRSQHHPNVTSPREPTPGGSRPECRGDGPERIETLDVTFTAPAAPTLVAPSGTIGSTYDLQLERPSWGGRGISRGTASANVTAAVRGGDGLLGAGCSANAGVSP
jgi:hypothetical protein